MNGLTIRAGYRDNPFNFRALAFDGYADIEQSRCFRLRFHVLGPMLLNAQQQAQLVANLPAGSYILRATGVQQDALATFQGGFTGVEWSMTDLGTGMRFFSAPTLYYGDATLDTPNTAEVEGWFPVPQLIMAPGKVSVVANGTIPTDVPWQSFIVLWVAEPIEGGL